MPTIRFIALLLFIVVAASCSDPRHVKPDHITFSYETLGGDTLIYRNVTPERFVLRETTVRRHPNDNRFKTFIYNVPSSPNLVYIKQDPEEDGQAPHYRDRIVIAGHSYMPDSFFYVADFDSSSPPRISALNAVYNFSFGRQDYLCVYLQDVTNPDAWNNSQVLLFDVTDTFDVKLRLSAYQASEDLRCFGDFNRDGRLDFADWGHGFSYRDTLRIYELRADGRGFEIRRDAFLHIVEDTSGGYAIDLNGSRWSQAIR